MLLMRVVCVDGRMRLKPESLSRVVLMSVLDGFVDRRGLIRVRHSW